MANIAFYIGSHGYGHAARQQAIINELAARGGQAHVRTAAPRKFFKRAASYHEQRYDIGMIQRDALTFDITGSLQWYADFLKEQAPLIAQEAAWCTAQGIQLIASDMPPFAMEVAAQVGVPSVLITHFTWDWVYEHYMDDYPEFAWIVDACRASYQKATLALQMPFAHPFEFSTEIEPMPLVYNPITQTRAAIRASLAVPSDHKLGLLSVGGHAWGATNIAALKQMRDWVFLVQPGAWDQVQDAPERFRMIPMDYDDHHNLIAAADIMIGKAGGSTTAEVIGHQTPFIYTLPNNWREAELLRQGLTEYGVGQYIEPNAFQHGAWAEQIEPLLQNIQPWPLIATDGAAYAARRLLALAD